MASQDTFSNRQHIIRVFFVIIAIVLIAKSFQLQIQDTSYAETARAVVISDLTEYPSRGLIYDRNQELLVTNRAMYDLMVIYNLVGDMDTLKFCRLLDITEKEFVANLEKDFNNDRFDKKVPFAFLKKISAEQYAKFQESLYEFPGFFVQIRNVRSYPHRVGAHVLGFVNEVTPEQIKKHKGAYSRGDYIGAKGLEAEYEEILKGTKGLKKVMKDNFGRIEGSWMGGGQDVPAISGYDLNTTLDIKLQQYAELLMKNKRGGIVAIEPSTGEILTMLSSPNYDPNILSINRERGEAFKALVQDSLRPFYDRSLMAQYPPGSIFKPLTALVGLQTEIWNENRGVGCQGGYDYGASRKLGCHSHEYISNAKMGIQHSCNSYFCQLFRDVVDQYGYENSGQGLDSLMSYIREFGLGDTLGIDLPNEKKGHIPGSDYYNKLYPKNEGSWKSPTVISLAIGQGEIQMTTLQMANAAATIANEGWYITPHLGKSKVIDGKTEPIPYSKHTTRINPELFEVVKDGMELAVKSGTARMADVPSFDLCGKTGTSQNKGTDHSVFFCFAPKENPQIAIAVFIENAGWGGSYAAPIASLMAEYYINKGQIDPSRAWIEERMINKDLLHAK